MANTLHADLLTAQTSGYPTGGYAPALRCILTSKDGGTTHDYSFDPTVTTNKLRYAQQLQEKYSDPGVIMLQNNDRTVPTDLTGYYVDLGWGHNTSSGVKWDSAVAPRMWVMHQADVSGGQKLSQPQLVTQFIMAGVWGAVLNQQPVLLISSPWSGIPKHRYDEENTIFVLTGLTIYEVLKYLIEVGLSLQTGLDFTLDDLGTQDDGQINSVIPFPSDNTKLKRTINDGAPSYYQTYGDLIISLMELTKCVLVPRAVDDSGNLPFRIIYPQASDTVNETYYSSEVAGHPFYEVENTRLNMVPNHIQIFGGGGDDGFPIVSGHWFDTDHYSGWETPAITATYDGPFMPVTAKGDMGSELWETGLHTAEECVTRAAELGWQLKDQRRGTRVVIPMDARVELGDRVQVQDSREY